MFGIFLLNSCATYHAKYRDVTTAKDFISEKQISHTVYLIGDAGKSPLNELNPVLKIFKDKLDRADKNSTAIFLGDNIYPAGFPDSKKEPQAYELAKSHLDAQLRTLENFKGRALFIPGNHDWYANGLVGLNREQEYIQEKLKSKEVFLPKNGCPLEVVNINKETVIIAIDTEWYLTNWDKHPNMNDDCEIKDREKFFQELEGVIKKNESKTTIIALHHPMFSYGNHGGQYTLNQQFYPSGGKIPLPVLGSLINVFRTTSGASIEDLQNKRYLELKKRIVTLAQYSDKVIFASGHEHSLQYIEEENTPQIVSGAGAKMGGTRLLNGSKFSYGGMGYATLEIYTDGSSRVRYFGLDKEEKEKFLFTSEVLQPDMKVVEGTYPDTFPSQVKASIYKEEETNKGSFHKFIWGERYRKYYSTKILAPTVQLDTLFGGVTPVRQGGGHQSKSLRLKDKTGKQYVMRALRKSAELYLQSMAFKDQYVVGDFEGTYTENLLSDFYTGSHPYAPFTVGVLSDAIGLYHNNPVLYYIPKQKALKEFNNEFGDELYMIEEHVSEGHDTLNSFGYAKEIKSTDDLLKNLRKDEKYTVDKDLYIRARLFDMLIGDWDRHVDQWRWAEFEEKGSKVYKPIPRDRDQVFSIMGDGLLMNLATRAIPGLTLMEGFNEEIRSVRGFNGSPLTFALDMTLLPETELRQWEEQATLIQNAITSTIIDEAFNNFPEEVRDETLVKLKANLLSRKEMLQKTAADYYKILNKYAIVTGTDKDDYFTISGKSEGKIHIIGNRIKGGEKITVFFEKTFDPKFTKEIWVYGLDDKDNFEVNGIDSKRIKLRIIGGHHNDTYTASNSKGDVLIYDQKGKKNEFNGFKKARINLTNSYETNTYQALKIKKSTNQLLPSIGANPDDGLRIGIANTYTFNGFRQNPFTQQHTVNAAFYFATSGFDLGYRGEFANVIGNWNLELAGKFTSPNFSINFFDFGNSTENEDNELGFDYNRVKLETVKIAPSLLWRGQLGGTFRTGISAETIEVEETENRFINTFYVANGEENRKSFVGVDAEYSYENSDNAAFPTMGMSTSLLVGYKTRIDEGKQDFAYVIPSLSLDHKLVSNGRLVLATKWKAHFNLGSGYEFYQGASIGANDGLRGFRNQRFTGKTSYYQLTDLRYSLRKVKTAVLPLTMGFYGGFDYGRVWFPEEISSSWHTSYGGGFFLNGADIISARLGLFNSEDGPRLSFGLGFGF